MTTGYQNTVMSCSCYKSCLFSTGSVHNRKEMWHFQILWITTGNVRWDVIVSNRTLESSELRLPNMWQRNQHNFTIKCIKQLLLSQLGRNVGQPCNFFKDPKKKHCCYIYKCSKKILKHMKFLFNFELLIYMACYLHCLFWSVFYF